MAPCQPMQTPGPCVCSLHTAEMAVASIASRYVICVLLSEWQLCHPFDIIISITMNNIILVLPEPIMFVYYKCHVKHIHCYCFTPCTSTYVRGVGREL